MKTVILYKSLIITILLLTSAILYNGIRKTIPGKSGDDPYRKYRIVFYNTENLFDINNDTLTNDDAFTPEGAMHWTRSRYKNKLNNLSKVFVAAGGWQPPDIIGLCEIENADVLKDLTVHTPVSKFSYRIVHRDSDDARGIDVALLYYPGTVKYINSGFYSLSKQGILTRDILYFKALLDTDTCHFFVNHWPSRSAGQLETEPARVAAAKLLRLLADSILIRNQDARIVIMGDFNDEPEDISLSQILGAHTRFEAAVPSELYNLSSLPPGNKTGTIKYQGQWSVFDQMIVSGALLSPSNKLKTSSYKFKIFDRDFLLTEDEQYSGKMPFRTYYGYRYQEGFSDHLPVYLDLE